MITANGAKIGRKEEMRSKEEIWRRAKMLMFIFFMVGMFVSLVLVWMIMQYGVYLVSNAYK